MATVCPQHGHEQYFRIKYDDDDEEIYNITVACSAVDTNKYTVIMEISDGQLDVIIIIIINYDRFYTVTRGKII